jgi:hypothetical protein
MKQLRKSLFFAMLAPAIASQPAIRAWHPVDAAARPCFYRFSALAMRPTSAGSAARHSANGSAMQRSTTPLT